MTRLTDAQLINRYRNLLIALARNREVLRVSVASIRARAATEAGNGRKAGLHCLANTMSRAASQIQFALGKNRDSMRHLFGTTKPDEVALMNMEGDQ